MNKDILPLVSISVVTYNHKDYISQCLDGILMQRTKFNFEIIIGEDESNDGTREICLNYAKKYPDKIKLFLRSRKDVIYINGRPTGRFNMIENLYAAQGKYIALCEGDDYWIDSFKLQKQFDFLENNKDVNICFTRANVLKDQKLELHSVPDGFIEQKIDFIELLRHYNFIATASVMLRNPEKLKLPKWFVQIPFGDLGLYKVLNKSGKIFCLNEITTIYRVHEGGLFSGISAYQAQSNYNSFYKIIDKVLNLEERQVIIDKKEKVLKTMSKLKFPKSKILQKFFYIYLKLKS